MNGPLFTVVYGIYTYLLLILVSNLFNGAGNFLILSLTFLITGIYLIATVIQGIYPNIVTHFLAVMSEIWKGTSIYLLIFTIIMHIISWVLDVPKIFFGIVLFILVPIIAIYGVYNADKIRIKNIDLCFDNLSKDIKFIHISDVHIGAIRGNRLLNNIVKKINNADQADVDFVVITGDLADGSSPIDSKSFEPLAKSKIPIFFTPGNHDFYPGISNVIKAAKAANIKILSNQLIEIKGTQLIGIPFGRNSFNDIISKNKDSDTSINSIHSINSTNSINSNESKNFVDFSHSFGLVGSSIFDNDPIVSIDAVGSSMDFNNKNTSYNNYNPKNHDGNDDNFDNNLNDVGRDTNKNNKDSEIEIDVNKTSILLHHVPVDWELFKDIGIDLVLSGHTHGGQFFPFNYFVKKVFPHIRGLYGDNGKYLYVSDGIGTLTPPMRLGTTAEMAVFQLRKKK